MSKHFQFMVPEKYPALDIHDEELEWELFLRREEEEEEEEKRKYEAEMERQIDCLYDYDPFGWDYPSSYGGSHSTYYDEKEEYPLKKVLGIPEVVDVEWRSLNDRWIFLPHDVLGLVADFQPGFTLHNNAYPDAVEEGVYSPDLSELVSGYFLGQKRVQEAKTAYIIHVSVSNYSLNKKKQQYEGILRIIVITHQGLRQFNMPYSFWFERNKQTKNLLFKRGKPKRRLPNVVLDSTFQRLLRITN